MSEFPALTMCELTALLACAHGDPWCGYPRDASAYGAEVRLRLWRELGLTEPRRPSGACGYVPSERGRALFDSTRPPPAPPAPGYDPEGLALDN